MILINFGYNLRPCNFLSFFENPPQKQIKFSFSEKIAILLYMFAKCSEIPSYISTMRKRNSILFFVWLTFLYTYYFTKYFLFDKV